jgi:hypothetical protein
MFHLSKKQLFFIFSLVLVLIAITGFTLAFIFGGISYSVKSLMYVIPIILSPIAVFLLWRGKSNSLFAKVIINKVSFIHLILIAILLFIVSVILLLSSPTRPWSYFVVISLVSGTIFAQIFNERPLWTDYLIIFEILAVSLNLTWGVALKYPLYFGFSDILGHLGYIETVIKTGHTAGISLAYQNYPLYHIFNAICIELTGISSRNSLFIFAGISWQVCILFAYMIFKKLSNSRIFSIIACLFFAFSSEIIFYGSYAVTRSLAFIFVLCFVYFALRKADVKYIILCLIMTFALIVTHHVTVIFFIPVLITFYICQILPSRTKSTESKIQILAIQLLVTGFFIYIFYVSNTFLVSALSTQMASIESVDIASSNISNNGTALTSIYYSFVIFFSLIGIGMAFFINISDEIHQGITGIAVASLIFLIFYIPGPLDIMPQAHFALLYRLPLIVSPFVLYIVAYGISNLANYEQVMGLRIFRQYAYYPFLTLIFVIIITFFSTISGSNADDNQYILKASNTSTKYLTNAEMNSFVFINNTCDHSLRIYGDQLIQVNTLYFNDFPSKQILMNGNIGYITQGYVILRSGELERTGGLYFSHTGKEEIGVYRYSLYQVNPEENILINLSLKDCIYDDHDVQVFIISQPNS